MRKQHYLNALGIQTWQLRLQHRANTPRVKKNQEIRLIEINSCTICQHIIPTPIIFGSNNHPADLMIICDTFDSNAENESAAKPQQRLLNAMLQSVGLQQKQVYLTTILKCPSFQHDSIKETNSCDDFLEKQIERISPKFLLCLGEIAPCYLLKTNAAFSILRGQLNSYKGIPLLVSFHPSYLLKNPHDKRNAFSDLQLLRDTIIDF